MMRAYWQKVAATIDSLSLRERALIFAAIAFVLASVVNTFLIEPLFARQKNVSQQVVQQQEKIKEIDAQIATLLEARKGREGSPQYQRMTQLRQQLAEGEAYLQTRRDRLVPPEKMAGLLREVLSGTERLQLGHLQTLPVTPLAGEPGGNTAPATAVAEAQQNAGEQVFRHGIQITVRGSYADMLAYLAALERLPAKMFWGGLQMRVIKYPVAELILTVYTLSLDKTWLRV